MNRGEAVVLCLLVHFERRYQDKTESCERRAISPSNGCAEDNATAYLLAARQSRLLQQHRHRRA